MTRLYLSWCKGLVDDKDVLRLLQEHGLGIETKTIEDVLPFRLAGVESSIHNPIGAGSVDNEDFFSRISRSPELLEAVQASEAPYISFHTGYGKLANEEEITRVAISNLRLASALLPKPLLVELPPFPMREGDDPRREYVTSVGFVDQILNETSAGLLVDASHIMISAYTRFRLGMTPRPECYLSELFAAAGPRIGQLHMNVPKMRDGALYDKHLQFSPGERWSEEILCVAKQVLAYTPALEAITLEMETGKHPRQHVLALIEQANYLSERLDLTVSCR
jgi:uncharacterized protein (UPF0276 family)